MTVNPQQDSIIAIERSQKLLERIPNIAWLMAESGEIVRANQHWYTQIGSCALDCDRHHGNLTSNHLCSRIFTDYLSESARDRFNRALAAARTSSERLKIELQLQNRAGEWQGFEVELELDSSEIAPPLWIGTACPIVVARANTDTQFLERLLEPATALECSQHERELALMYGERLTQSLAVAKVGAWSWNLTEDRLFWTEEFERLFDYAPGTTKQTYAEWQMRLHPEDRPATEALIAAIVAGDAPPECRLQYRTLRTNGEIRWIDATGELYTDARGQRFLSGLVCDITDRKRNEEALQRSEEFTRRILESTKDCIKVLDLEGRLLYMNDGGRAMMEIDDFDAVAQQPWAAFWQGSDRQRATTALNAALAGSSGKFEGFCATAKGTPKWWEVVVTPILGTSGQIERILSVSRDITDRQQAAVALQASEELYRYTFARIPIGLAHVTLDGSLFRVNQKFCEIVGYSEAELLNMTFRDFTEPADLHRDFELIDRLLHQGQAECTIEKRYIHKLGHHVWVSLSVSLARDNAEGTPQYFLAAVKDVTERKELELRDRHQTAALQQLNSALLIAQQRLNERNEQLDRFVYLASHDLKAPLRAIANLAQWIEDDYCDILPAEAQQQLQLLGARVKRMDALIEGLLQYSRVGKDGMPDEPIDLNCLVAETLDSLSPPPNFQIEIAEPLPTIAGNRLLLQQVFANLLSNAIEHHPGGDGHIWIQSQDLGDRYQISIADNGSGIPTDARERIFEIFQTLKPNSSSKNTGIGLAIVKKIVEGRNGQIWIDDNYTAGARFCFTLPK